jgi:HEPN domain-containing protein
MKTINSKTLFADADQMLELADTEMNRAEEDVVTHLVCHNSRQSIANYLSGFLLDKGISIYDSTSLAELLSQCKSVDQRFAQLDLSAIHCRFEGEPDDYCLDTEEVGRCLDVARQARELVVG